MSNLTSPTSSSPFLPTNGGAAFSAPKLHEYLFDKVCQLVFDYFCSLFIGGEIIQTFESSFPILNVIYISSIVHDFEAEEVESECFRSTDLYALNVLAETE